MQNMLLLLAPREALKPGTHIGVTGAIDAKDTKAARDDPKQRSRQCKSATEKRAATLRAA